MKTPNKPGSMTIHRAHLRVNFCTLPNALLQDKALSFRARGVLAMMLSMPSQWQTYHSWITEQGTEGEEAIRTALRELEAAGYLTKKQRREAGKMAGFQWDWYCQPVPVAQRTRYRRAPEPGNPGSGFIGSGKSATIKDPVHKVPNGEKTESKEPKETSSRSEKDAAVFESVWKPSKISKEDKLKRIKPPDQFPSQDEFEEFLSSNDLVFVITYRPDIYLDLCRNKWCRWLQDHNRWQAIRDWRAYVKGLEKTLLNAYPETK